MSPTADREFDPTAIDGRTLRDRLSVKHQAYPADVLAMWIAEMDFPLARPVADALHAAIDRSDTGYRSGVGVAEALADFVGRSWSWDLDPARVLILADVLTAISQALRALTSSGDAVVVTPPVYPPFYSTVRLVAEREVVDVPLRRTASGGFELDLEQLARAFARPEVSAFLLCSPHNPTGHVPHEETLREVAHLAERHGVVVIADEIHAPLTLVGARHVPYLSVASDDASAVSLMSASKAWNIPGLKCAQIVGTGRTHSALAERIPVEVLFGAGHLGAIASVAAYREGGPWLRTAIDVIGENQRSLRALLAAELPHADVPVPEATYLAWIDLSGYGVGADPAPALLERGRLAVSSGVPFGPGGAGHIRLNVGTSPARVADAVARMARALTGGPSPGAVGD